jgi:PD-(D/E)XK nuclease superfamily
MTTRESADPKTDALIGAAMEVGRRLATSYRVDLVCYDQVLVELKALRGVAGPEEAQVLNHLKASGLGRALLLNFGSPSLESRRFVWSARPSAAPSSASSVSSAHSADASSARSADAQSADLLPRHRAPSIM